MGRGGCGSRGCGLRVKGCGVEGNMKVSNLYLMDGIMHNWSNPFCGVLSNQALKVLTFLVNQAAEIKPLKA